MNEITLPSRHRIINSSPGGLAAENDTTRLQRLPTISKTDDTKKPKKEISSLANLLQSASQSWRCLELLLIYNTYGATKAFGDERDDYGDPGLYAMGGGGREFSVRVFLG